MKRIIFFIGLILIPVILFAINSTNISKTEEINNGTVIVPETDDECGTIKALIDFRAGIKMLRPPTGPKYVYSTNFIIHFDTTGTRAITRAQAESVSTWAEYTWAKQIDTLGWDEPPPDNNHGGDNRYDIYIMGVNPNGYAGVTVPDEEGPDPNQEDWTSWVELTINPLPFWSRPLVAHEFNHACQFSYSGYEGGWWYENTSEWMEKITMGIDHLRVGHGGDSLEPLGDPHLRITREEGGYQYAGGLWPRFLGEYYDLIWSRCPRRIWTLCGLHWGNNTLKDIDSTLYLYYDSDLPKALSHYAIWRYFTGTRSSSYYFSESPSYVTSTILRTHSTYPASGTQGTSNPSGPGGCNFIQFNNLGDNRITLYFDGQNGYEWEAYVIGRLGSSSIEFKIPLESGQDTGRITIPGWGFSEIVLIPVATQWTGTPNDLTYSYIVSQTPHLDKPADGILAKEERILFPMLHIEPNPFQLQTAIRYAMPEASINPSLEIYDATGRLVTSHQPLSSSHCFIWDGKDMNGRKVQNGIYFCCLTTDNQITKKRITVLR